MHKSYNGVTDLSRSFAEQGWAMFHTVRMLFLTIMLISYSLIHVGAKRAVESYEDYGHQHHENTGLRNAVIRVHRSLW